jgi:hypothetical protein
MMGIVKYRTMQTHIQQPNKKITKLRIYII